MSRLQRLGIGNGGIDCQISYMQSKKYPNAGDIVKPVQGVSNKSLLKNPYNNLSVSVAQPGDRPLRITTDNRGNVFARSETMLVPGVTNNNLLKNPYNIKSVTASEKRTLSLQRIKDINNKMLPSYITENKGVNEVMLQVLTMIQDKPVKLITIQLLKILITKNVAALQDKSQQKMLDALNAFDICLTDGRRIFRENTLSPTKIPEMMAPVVERYVASIKQIYGNMAASPNIDREIQAGLTELGLLSNALTRMFEYNNAVDPSNTLSRDQINAAAYSGWDAAAPAVSVPPVGPVPPVNPVPPVGPPVGPVPVPPAGLLQLKGPMPSDNPFELPIITELFDKQQLPIRYLVGGANTTMPILKRIFSRLDRILASGQQITEPVNAQLINEIGTDLTQNDDIEQEYEKFKGMARHDPNILGVIGWIDKAVIFFFKQKKIGLGRRSRKPKHSRVIFQTGSKTHHKTY